MEAEFRSLVIAASGLPVQRVNWGEDPGETGSAYVTLHLIGQREGRTMQGPDGLITTRVQVDCYAPDFLGARVLATGIVRALDGRRDQTFRALFFDNLRATREAGANEGEAIYRRSLDFITHWRAADAG